jgi:hypothetical protein
LPPPTARPKPNQAEVEGHVYPERIRDDDGNKFYVVLKVIAADQDSRYMALVCRCLPGGKAVKRR